MEYPNTMLLSTTDVVKLFELAAHEISRRIAADRISPHDVVRARVWAKETVARTETAISNSTSKE